MNAFKRLAKEIVTSKKAIATLASLGALAAKRYGWDIPEEQLGMLMGALGAYVVGQGIADAGKGKTLAEASAKGGAFEVKK